MKQWKESKPEVGDFVKLGELSVDKSGKTLTTSQLMDFTGRDLTLTCVYNYLDMQVTSVTLDENYSMGEKMQKAAMNTLMGLGTVFMILILISLVIYGFKVIRIWSRRQKRKTLRYKNQRRYSRQRQCLWYRMSRLSRMIQS